MAKKKSKEKKRVAIATFDEDTSLDYPAMSLRSLRKKNIPTDLVDQIKKSQSYQENNDLIQSLVGIVVDFGVAGFHNSVVDSKGKEDKESETWFNNLCQEHNMDGLLLSGWEDLVTTENLVFYWKLSGTKKVEYVEFLDPSSVDVVPLFGKAAVYVKPDAKLVQLIKSPKTPEEKKRVTEIPEKWIKAAKGQGPIGHRNYALLENKEGEYWIIANTGGRIDRLVKPKMCAIFDSIVLRDLLIDGDYSIAYYIKNLITHIKAGESITSGPRAGSRDNWASKEDLDELKKSFKTPSKAIRLFSRHNTSVEFIIPDTAAFNPDKYKAVDGRIMKWAGIGLALMVGEGGNYATAYVNIKRLVTKIKKFRRIMGRTLEEFYRQVKPNNRKVPKVEFDEQSLKEPRQLREEVSMLVKQGIISVQGSLESFGRHYKVEKARKQEEGKEKELWLPIYESGQGMAMLGYDEDLPNGKKPKEGKPGRPLNDVPSEPSPFPQNPKPSTSTEKDELIDALLSEIAPFANMPEDAFDLWEKVYNERKKSGASAASAAKQAYAAIKSAGWHRNKEGKWTKRKSKKGS